jgi:hypothetical protein
VAFSNASAVLTALPSLSLAQSWLLLAATVLQLPRQSWPVPQAPHPTASPQITPSSRQ